MKPARVTDLIPTHRTNTARINTKRKIHKITDKEHSGTPTQKQTRCSYEWDSPKQLSMKHGFH